MSRARNNQNRNGLPDPRRRAELQQLAIDRRRHKQPTKIRVRVLTSDPLHKQLTSPEVDPSAVLAEAIVKNLDVLGEATVARLNRPNGSAQRLQEFNMRVHWQHAERFLLAANAHGMSNCLAAEVLLRASLLGDPTIAF